MTSPSNNVSRSLSQIDHRPVNTQKITSQNYLIENEKENHGSRFGYKSAPKSTCLLLAQLMNNTIEYTSELTYFAINTFQTSSLRRVQVTTLARFRNYCVPRVCAFYYSLDREFEEFVRRMRQLCKRTQNTFLDIRAARIHFPQSSMSNTQETHRSLDVLKCNIERLRDLKQIHQDLGHDLLLPNDQLFVALDLLVTNFELVLCELDNRVRFRDSIILQSFIKDMFLQFRVALTWLYPAVKMAAYREGDPSKEFAVKKCDMVDKTRTQNCGSSIVRERDVQQSTAKLFDVPMSAIKIAQNRSQSALSNIPETIGQASMSDRKDVTPSIEQSDEESVPHVIDPTEYRSIDDDSRSYKNTDSQLETEVLLNNDVSQVLINHNKIIDNNNNKNYSGRWPSFQGPLAGLSFTKKSTSPKQDGCSYMRLSSEESEGKLSQERIMEHCLLSDKDKEWYDAKLNEIQRRLDADQSSVKTNHHMHQLRALDFVHFTR